MRTPETVPEILSRIERAMERVDAAIAPLSAAAMQEPRLADGWSVKDVLAHLAWWDLWLLVTLPADGETSPPTDTLPLAEQIPPTAHWAEEMNAKVHAYNQPRSLTQIQAEFARTREELLRRVSRLSADDLVNPAGMAALIGQPVAPLVHGIYEHYEEHADVLEQLERR